MRTNKEGIQIMDEKELAEKVNAVLADILMEAARVVAKSETLTTIDEVLQQAVFNLAYDAHTSCVTH